MKKQAIKVISAFAGLGKTTLAQKYENICDLQTSQYRYHCQNINLENKEEYEKLKGGFNKEINPNWPNNYIAELKKAIQEYDLVLVPSNADVRKILTELQIPFLFVLPKKTNKNKEILLKRYQARKNTNALIKKISDYFDCWSRNQEDYSYPIYVMEKVGTLEEVVIKLKIIKKKG